MTDKPGRRDTSQDTRYESIFGDISDVIDEARRSAARSVNSVMTAAYWLIGRRIVVSEQAGSARADYGQVLIKRLSTDLTAKFGRGFGAVNLSQMKKFYLLWSPDRIFQTPSEKFKSSPAEAVLSSAAKIFTLPWSSYVRLLSVKSENARLFYEKETLRGGWNVRQLNRQINSQFYERTALSRNKAAMLKKGQKALPEDYVFPEEEIKEPYMLEFLGLKDEYSETDLEDALTRHLESFLLELGSDFCFIGRQKRLRIGGEWYRVDLLFFHRRLRCLVIIDLKIGKFTHADAGQMHLYLNYALENWVNEDENPPVGLILCAYKDEAVARYALERLPNKVMAAEYRTLLPGEMELVSEIERTQAFLQERKKGLLALPGKGRGRKSKD
jgi:predicted nuclease of restriction endonuclease-like (RecB) superfamily